MSVQTPNYSRPLPSPFADMEASTRTPRTAICGPLSTSLTLNEILQSRPAFSELSLSSSLSSDMEVPKASTATQQLLGHVRDRSSVPGQLMSGKGLYHGVKDHCRRLSRASTGSKAESTDTENNELNMDRPILHFRPHLWKHLDCDWDKLNLDLFWPIKLEAGEDEEDNGPDIFPHDGLKPLCSFRRLRSLQLNGMMQSHQRIIWHTAWLNPGLEELILEMAMGPLVIKDRGPKFKIIHSDTFHLSPGDEGSVEYLGAHGEGVLHEEFGEGEYLDKQAIATAKLDCSPSDQTPKKLSIVKLVLMGFVVDAGPFSTWFDPNRLREVVFKDNCIDAGFALPATMENAVKVSLAGGAVTRTAIPPGTAKLITLKNGHKVDIPEAKKQSEPARLRKKFSGILRQWKSKENDKAVMSPRLQSTLSEIDRNVMPPKWQTKGKGKDLS